MDDTNELEALEKVYRDACTVKAFKEAPLSPSALLAVRDAVLASLAARGGTLSAETMAEYADCVNIAPDYRWSWRTFAKVLAHAAAQGATIAALQQRAERAEKTLDEVGKAISEAHPGVKWAWSAAPWLIGVIERQRVEALDRAEQAKRERDVEAARVRIAKRMRDGERTARVSAESALATLRQAAVKAAAELRHTYRPDTRDWNLVARAIRILEEATTPGSTPAPEHHDTAAHDVRDVGTIRRVLRFVGGPDAVRVANALAVSLDDSGPSGGWDCAACDGAGESTMASVDGVQTKYRCAQCGGTGAAPDATAPGLAACVPQRCLEPSCAANRGTQPCDCNPSVQVKPKPDVCPHGSLKPCGMCEPT